MDDCKWFIFSYIRHHQNQPSTWCETTPNRTILQVVLILPLALLASYHFGGFWYGKRPGLGDDAPVLYRAAVSVYAVRTLRSGVFSLPSPCLAALGTDVPVLFHDQVLFLLLTASYGE